MVHNTGREIFFSSIRAGNNFQGLKNGSTVKAKILSLNGNSTARIFFNGTIFEGNIAGSVKEGEILNMRVLITGDKIMLIPESEAGMQKLSQNDNLFAQLGLPKNELSSAILSFLMTSESRFDSKTTNRLFDFLKNIKKNKKKAAFAAGLLENKGLALDKELFRKVYPLIFGEEFKDDAFDDDAQFNMQGDGQQEQSPDNYQSNDDVLELINHIKTRDLHWLVLPFEKQIAETSAKGSISLLLDTKLHNCKKLIMHCRLDEELWLFSFQDKTLKFMQEQDDGSKPMKPKARKALEELMWQCLKENGLKDISVKYESIIDEDAETSIDLSV